MKNLKFLILLCLFPILGNAQESENPTKWYSTAELELVIPTKVHYTYRQENRVGEANIDVAIALGAQYTINYMLFKKFSVGALAGYEQQFRPDFSILKLGGVIRFFFVDPDNVYIYLEEVGDVPVNSSQFKGGNNLRLGLGFPIIKRDNFNINTNIFIEKNYLDLRGADALLFRTEEPVDIYLNTIGVSLGAKF